MIEKSQKDIKRMEKLKHRDLNKQEENLNDRIISRMKSQ